MKTFKEIKTADACLKEFFDDEVIQFITDESNKYAHYILDLITQKKHPNKDLKPFKIKEIQKKEIHLFLSLIIIMGFVRLPDLKSYWTVDPLMATIPFRYFMTRNRFLYILRFLHVVDLTQIPTDNSDPIIRVREFSEMIKKRFRLFGNLGKELAIDEIIIPSKGRCKFRQYIKTKRHRFGIKVWSLCDSISAYIYNFDIYTGKDTHTDSNKGTDLVVMNLLTPLKTTDYNLYMDAFFTSVPLFDKLNEKGYGVTGVIKSNRKHLPKELSLVGKKDKGKIVSFRRGNMLCFNFIDNKPVHMLTNIHSNKILKVEKVFSENFTKTRSIPDAIYKYNKFAHGVDRIDQLMSYYKYLHKNHKVWKRIFFFLFESSITNAFINYKRYNSIKMDGIVFRKKLARSLLGIAEIMPYGKKKHFNTNFYFKRTTERHFLVRGTYVDCVVCSNRKRNKRKRTSIKCEQCDLAMCMPCFKIFHTRPDY